MKLHPRLSRAAVELVTRFETFQPLAQAATLGGWTVGYGHTRSARDGAQVNRSDAEALLLYDLSAAAEGVEAALFAPVTQRQFEALTAFAFNIGADNFRRSSALARMNGGAELDAADEIERWRHAELGAGAQVVDALVRRRAAEKAHFLGLPEGFSKSPSAVLRPLAVGGLNEAEPPPREAPLIEASLLEAASTLSATLSAANTVQARLRKLVPDPEPAPVTRPLEPVVFPPPEVVEREAARTPPAEPPLVVEEAAPAPPAYAPPPPPVPQRILASPPANDIAPPSMTPEPPPAPATSSPSAPALAMSASRPSLRTALSPRAVYAALIAIGACLLVAAVVLILGGKAGFGDLGLGVVGALLMTPGVYGLMGPPRSKA